MVKAVPEPNMSRIRHWASLKKLTEITDVVSKLLLAAAALAAVQFFIRQPDVTLASWAQAFLDRDVVRPLIESSLAQLPPDKRDTSRDMVQSLIAEYNSDNERDLALGSNTTAEKATVAELCQKVASELLAVFNVRCSDPSLTTTGIGRGRTYERRLLLVNQSAGSPLDVDGLKAVLRSLQAGEYGRARCRLTNVGNAKAINVTIRTSEGYYPAGGRANDPFSLNAGEKDIIREFETDRGILERDPRLQFGVDWDRASRSEVLDKGLFISIGIILVVIFVAFLVNDIMTTP